MNARIFSPVCLLGVLILGGLAAAQPSSPAATQSSPSATTSTAEANDLDRIVCKSGPPPTGSRIGVGRECHTQREWDRRMHEQQQELTRQQINRGCSAGGC